MKEECTYEDRNDSGVTSGGSDLQSSPGSENSEEFNSLNYTITPTNINYYPRATTSYFTPLLARTMPAFPTNLNTPIPSDDASSKKPQILKNDKTNNGLIPPRTSPLNLPKNSREKRQEEIDPLRRLRMSFEMNDLLPPLSPNNSGNSTDGDSSKSDTTSKEHDQNLRVPKVNSHGKVKTFKCRHCDFVAVKQREYYRHCRSHIKNDKLLECHKCDFVTEYKHHFEYHLNNHYGTKPFKCDKCSYSCVNKSMLNSHMKSHSNVYQYRCSNCGYATKYCHSLKLHLRKYKHKPDVVLNADGTPNPLPIIDVYGTRRGPKQKPTSRHDNVDQASRQAFQNSITQLMLNASPQLHFPFPYPFLDGFRNPFGNPLLLQQNLLLMAQRGMGDLEGNEAQSSEAPTETPADNSEVLDLSKPDTSEPAKNRRKGKAYKLDVNKPESDSEEEEEEEEEEKEEGENVNDDKMEVETCAEEVTDNNNKQNSYNCSFCSITFADYELFIMHMGCHGHKDPFTCNMCGEQCGNKISLSLHIVRNAHA